SALVEENAATAKTLEFQAKSMDERVASFRLRGQDAGNYGAGDDSVDAAEPSVRDAPQPYAPPSRGPAAALRLASARR
ncbi:MAG: hypothetical protein PSV22_08740, partial [Pseudolabrys sp.]|nr:hypothetical protein [Pseudolabrys sp.]